MFQAKNRKNPQLESGIEKIIGGCHISPLFFFLKFGSILESLVLLFLFFPLSSTPTTLIDATHLLSRTEN